MPLLIALTVFLLAGFALTRVLQQRAAPAKVNESTTRGVAQLGQLRWREFVKLVLQAMHGRGYRLVFEADTPPDGVPSDGSDILLERNGDLALLSCKFGSASTVGVQALLGLSKSASLRGASHAIVVSPGRFDEEAERLAQQQHIELIDGETLWPEVRPYVAHPVEAPAPAASVAKPDPKAAWVAWGGAAALALVAGLIAYGLAPADAGPDATTQSVVRPAAKPAAAGTKSAAPDAAELAAIAAIPTDPAQLETRRRETANAISTLFGVDRAVWSTQSTLLVYLSAEEADPSVELCPLLERYPELAASRVQLQPPQGSQRPVRFKQCRSY